MLEVPYTQERRLYGDKRMPCRVTRCAEKGCDHEVPIFITNVTGGLPPAVYHKKLKQEGWEVLHGKAFCPDHHRKDKAKKPKQNPRMPVDVTALPEIGDSIDHHAFRVAPIPEQTQPVQEPPIMASDPTPIRSLSDLGEASATRIMNTEQRRKITREIMGNWDEQKSHYIGEMTDHRIAVSLGFPRAWVEQVRVENFGDDGGNDEIDDLKAALDAKLKDWDQIVANATRLVDKAVEAVGAMEKMRGELKAMRQRLERVEVATLPRRA